MCKTRYKPSTLLFHVRACFPLRARRVDMRGPGTLSPFVLCLGRPTTDSTLSLRIANCREPRNTLPNLIYRLTHLFPPSSPSISSSQKIIRRANDAPLGSDVAKCSPRSFSRPKNIPSSRDIGANSSRRTGFSEIRSASEAKYFADADENKNSAVSYYYPGPISSVPFILFPFSLGRGGLADAREL